MKRASSSALHQSSMWWVFYLVVVTAVTFALFGDTIPYPLVADDYAFVEMGRRSLAEVLGFTRGHYHYYPLTQFIYYIMYALFGTAPAPYHILVLVLHIINCVLLAMLARAVGRGRVVALAAAILFTTSSLTYEVPLWTIGLFSALSTALYLFAFLAYVQYRRSRQWRWLVAFVGSFVLAFLSHEQAITLIVGCALYRVIVEERSINVFRFNWQAWLIELGPPALLLGLFVAAKLFFTQGELFVNRGDIKYTFWSIRISTLQLLIPNSSLAVAAMFDDVGRPFLILRLLWWGALLAGAVWVMVRSGPATSRLLAGWLLAHVVIVTFAVPLASRHFYLPLVLSTILVAGVLSDLLGWLLSRLKVLRPPVQQRMRDFLLLIITLAFAVQGATILIERKSIWRAAAEQTASIVRVVNEAYWRHSHCTQLYLVNLPDGLSIPGGDVAYIFRTSAALALYQAGIPRTVRISELHTADAVWNWSVKRGDRRGLVSEAEIGQYACANGTLVMRASPAGDSFVIEPVKCADVS